MLANMTEYALAAVALATMSMIIAAARMLQRERRRVAQFIADWTPDELPPVARARYEDHSGWDPTYWLRAAQYGHDPDLSALERDAIQPLFARFDRVMTDAFNRL